MVYPHCWGVMGYFWSVSAVSEAFWPIYVVQGSLMSYLRRAGIRFEFAIETVLHPGLVYDLAELFWVSLCSLKGSMRSEHYLFTNFSMFWCQFTSYWICSHVCTFLVMYVSILRAQRATFIRHPPKRAKRATCMWERSDQKRARAELASHYIIKMNETALSKDG